MSTPFSDQLSIDTPEQVALDFNIAGLGSRFVAVLLDHLIVVAFFVVEFLGFALLAAGVRNSGPSTPASDTAAAWAAGIIIFLNFCVFWLYFTLFETFWKGKTPGKHVMKLRVLKDSGRQITFFEALTRNLLRIADWLPGAYFAGMICMALNKSSKRLGDFAAGTIVVHERLAEQPMLLTTATTILAPAPVHFEAVPAFTQDTQQLFAADAIARLNARDLITIDTYFARMLDLSMEMRATLSSRIAAQLCAKMQAPLPEGNSERTLEAIASAMRRRG